MVNCQLSKAITAEILTLNQTEKMTLLRRMPLLITLHLQASSLISSALVTEYTTASKVSRFSIYNMLLLSHEKQLCLSPNNSCSKPIFRSKCCCFNSAWFVSFNDRIVSLTVLVDRAYTQCFIYHYCLLFDGTS